MQLWHQWWRWYAPLRSSCARYRTFLWMGVVLVGFSVRDDLWGVSSFLRALGLGDLCYTRLLAFFHSPALDVHKLSLLWAGLVIRLHPGLLRCNGRLVLVGDGIKIGKAGKKMPGVKRLHQESESNTKPPYILGHSCQAVAILVQNQRSTVALPLAARIHEGVVFSNRDQRTLLDKMLALLVSLGFDQPYYFVADAYYASRKMATPLLRLGNHLLSRVRNNAVAYLPAPVPQHPRPGRPRKYGPKVLLQTLFDQPHTRQIIESPVYGETGVQLGVWSRDLLWRPVGILVRFVAVLHPTRGRLILMSTDLSLAPRDIILLYSYRFKIEVTFKSALHVLGAFFYHFWMRAMIPISRSARNQYLHHKTVAYRQAVLRKLAAYHRFIQLGLIAQGILLALATTVPHLVWASFGSWFRTIRPGIAPSEAVVTIALRNSLPEFLADSSPAPDLAIFIQQRLDLSRTQAQRLAS